MEQVLYPLPKGWEWHGIDEVAQIGADRGFSPTPDLEGNIPFVGMTDIDQKTGQESTYELRKFDDVKKGYTKFQRNAVLFAKITPCTENNKTALIDSIDGGFATTEVFPIHALEGVEPKYLLHFFRSPLVRRFLIDQMEGATGRQRVPLKALKNVNVPICGIQEQKCIVEKLDALLTRIDTAIEHLQESVTLTDSMLLSGMEKAFNPLGLPPNEAGLYKLPKEWAWQNLGSISTIGTGVTPLKGRADYYNNGDINWVTSKATGDDFVSYCEQKITEVALSECRLKVFPVGTLIVALYGQGKTRGQVSELMIESTINQALAGVVVNPNHNSKFVKYFLKRSYLSLRSKASGGTQENLNLSIIKAIQVPLPDIQQQRKIVLSLDALNHQINQVKSEFTSKIELLNQLKASILDSAFKGEL